MLILKNIFHFQPRSHYYVCFPASFANSFKAQCCYQPSPKVILPYFNIPKAWEVLPSSSSGAGTLTPLPRGSDCILFTGVTHGNLPNTVLSHCYLGSHHFLKLSLNLPKDKTKILLDFFCPSRISAYSECLEIFESLSGVKSPPRTGSSVCLLVDPSHLPFRLSGNVKGKNKGEQMTSRGGHAAVLIFVDWPIEVVMRQNYRLGSEQTWSSSAMVFIFSWGISKPGRRLPSARQTPNPLVRWQEISTPVCIFPRRP